MKTVVVKQEKKVTSLVMGNDKVNSDGSKKEVVSIASKVSAELNKKYGR